MRIIEDKIIIHTNKRREIINITDKIEGILRKINIKNGILNIFVPHTTAALIINEYEPNIQKDYLNLLERLVPESGDYHHNKIDNNADSHLLSSILKPFLIIPIIDGKLGRGVWQDILFVELDGPRERKIILITIGE